MIWIYPIDFQIKKMITIGIIATKKSEIRIHNIEATASNREMIGFANPPVVPVEIALVATVPS